MYFFNARTLTISRRARRFRLLLITLLLFLTIFTFGTITRRSYNHLLIPIEQCIGCPGEGGRAVYLSAKEKLIYNETVAMTSDFFNIYASKMISLWRTIPDTRHARCKAKHYNLKQLPSASVVVVFKNERFTVLMRTVYSVILRSPPSKLKEIILVDDQSELEELKSALDEYCRKHFGNFVKILRASRRLGLIQGKNYGARHAIGDVIVFLDAHCEANKGWLEPILERIKESKYTIVCPIIDHINAETFAYSGQQIPQAIGGFSWAMFYKWIYLSKEASQKIDITKPIPSPTMAGGLLAVDRNAFFELGAYDDGMEVWGAENLEISFRTWMCGGSVEFHPCSHVGHVYRSGHPYNMTGEKGANNVNGMNSVRLVEVWLDEFKKHFYRINKNLKNRFHNDQDLSERHELRKRLQCKSFKWYLEKVYPEKMIPDKNVLSHGTIKNAVTGLCFDTLGKSEIGAHLSVFPLQPSGSNNQYFSFYLNNHICVEDACLAVNRRTGNRVIFVNEKNAHKWSYTSFNQIMYEDSSGEKLCISVLNASSYQPLFVQKCNDNDVLQKWILENYTSEK